ncbi:PEPxxWA-CTERM sorting domain-containing protein [Phenylobacterium sp.]|uniref:PEPxxWA-CTERM sorting domain-containing protein n=1 Tax=Phenylobacterium sp. TaxID=1871053 RepID=UPI0025CD254B|nr:PEPxxWA-CTERM sorting domain-containing protein [Phenylobacterium sp.]
MSFMKTTIAALTLGSALICLPAAASAATVNYALSSAGAGFVSGSSIIPDGTFGLSINYATMQNNLITNTPGPGISNGDPRYIFGAFDPDGTVEIDLGQVRTIFSLGANVQLPSMGDRYILGPFHAAVSTDGASFTTFGSPVSSVAINGATVNPVSLSAPAQGVRYIRYSFGPDSQVFPGNGGSAVYQVFANGSSAPEPATWAMMLLGFGGAGLALRRRGGALYRLVEALPGGVQQTEEFDAPDDATAFKRAAAVAEGHIELWRGAVRIAPQLDS